MDIKQRIEVAKINIKKAENQKTIKETQLKTAQEQLEEVIKKLAEEGVTPMNVADEVVKLEAEIGESLTKIEGLIPKL